MKITKNIPKPVQPPATFTIELSQKEAEMLRAITGGLTQEVTSRAAARVCESAEWDKPDDYTLFRFNCDLFDILFKSLK